ncbi:MAG TPA: hypothetical protein VF607_03535 [Verrucomicrobiae bacterium]
MYTLALTLLWAITMTATIALLVRRPVRSLVLGQVIFTALVLVANVINARLGLWLQSLPAGAAERQTWQTRMDLLTPALLLGTLLPWIIFTAYHVVRAYRQAALKT